MTDRPRRPQVFEPSDPRVLPGEPEPELQASGAEPADARRPSPLALPDRAGVGRGIRWGGILLSAMLGLALLAASLSFARFVSDAVLRDDWIGWTAMGLVAIAGLAAIVLAGRETIGLFRLARLGALRREADALVLKPDAEAERALTGRLVELLAKRPANAWALARFRDHRRDVHDAGQLLRLADRELFAPLDREARRFVLTSAKRVATVTAISPLTLVSVGFVLVENLRLMRRLAALYGGRPGFLGGLRLARLVVTHIVATGGIAMTDDLLGQFLGQDLVRRLSRRLGEGIFNGALTARLGVAAIEVCRPLPFVEAPAVRARDVIVEAFRGKPADT